MWHTCPGQGALPPCRSGLRKQAPGTIGHVRSRTGQGPLQVGAPHAEAHRDSVPKRQAPQARKAAGGPCCLHLSRLGNGGLVTPHLIVTSGGKITASHPELGRTLLRGSLIAKKDWFLGTNAKIQNSSCSFRNPAVFANTIHLQNDKASLRWPQTDSMKRGQHTERQSSQTEDRTGRAGGRDPSDR